MRRETLTVEGMNRVAGDSATPLAGGRDTVAEGDRRAPAPPPEGGRHDELLRMTCSWASRGVPIHEVRAAAQALAATWQMVGREREVDNLVDGAFDKVGRKGGLPARALPLPVPVDLVKVTAVPPRFTVANLYRRPGFGICWAQPGGYKTRLQLRIAFALISEYESHLLGHPALTILERASRVLYVGTEEQAAEMAWVRDSVLRGMNSPDLCGEIIHLYAGQPGCRRVTMDDLGSILGDHGPFDRVVLDSMTGLRPKLVNGERIRWDADNDAANEMCLRLRALSVEHDTFIELIHHSDKGVTNYRGPTDWWASADGMLGLFTTDGRVKCKPQKVRGGRVHQPFLLDPVWKGSTLRFDFVGGDEAKGRTPTQRKVLEYLTGAGRASQHAIVEGVDASRSSVLKALAELEAKGLVTRTGELHRRSPIWQVSEAPCGQLDAKE